MTQLCVSLRVVKDWGGTSRGVITAGRGCQPCLATRESSRKSLPLWHLCVCVGPCLCLLLLGPACVPVQDNVSFKAFPVVCLPRFCHIVVFWRAFRKPLMCGYGKELVWTTVSSLQWLQSPSLGQHPCTCSALQVAGTDIFYPCCGFVPLPAARLWQRAEQVVQAPKWNHTNLKQQPQSWTSNLEPLNTGGVAHALWKVCVCLALWKLLSLLKCKFCALGRWQMKTERWGNCNELNPAVTPETG